MKRDPKRINEVLDALKSYWVDNPDLRLGQIISNAAYVADIRADLFYIEDYQIIEGIKKLQPDNGSPDTVS